MNKYKYEGIYKDLISSFSPAYVKSSPWYVGKSILPIYKEIPLDSQGGTVEYICKPLGSVGT